jgi:hypothetical protein
MFLPLRYLRRTAGYTLLNHKRNEAMLEELHVTPLDEKLSTYRHNWFQHFHRMEDNRLPKQLLNYHPKGRRRPERPLKRLLDDMTAETETGHPGLNSWMDMMMSSSSSSPSSVLSLPCPLFPSILLFFPSYFCFFNSMVCRSETPYNLRISYFPIFPAIHTSSANRIIRYSKILNLLDYRFYQLFTPITL